GIMGKCRKDREIGEYRKQAARHNDGFAADPVRQGAENDKERHTKKKGCTHKQARRLPVHLQHLGEEEERIELARVPDDGLTGGEAKQRDQHQLHVAPLAEAFLERRLGERALLLHLLEKRGLIELEPDPDRNAEQDDGKQEGNAPAPVLEAFLVHHQAAAKNDKKREEETERCRCLDPCRIGTALPLRRVLRNINRCTAIFTTQRKA